MRLRPLSSLLAAAATLAIFAAVLGCSITTSDKKGKDQDVDIRTPMGSLKVNTAVDPKDIGLALYPGATPYSESGEDHHGRANVNISSAVFGVKVIAAEFRSNDSPDKVLAFYRKELGKMGSMLECPDGVDADVKGDQKDWSQEIRCRSSREPGRASGEVDLAVGTRSHHHLVNVKPLDGGCRFALVYVETHGERQPM